MFPEWLLEDLITWEEYVKRHNIEPQKAKCLYKAMEVLFESRNQKLPKGVAYFREDAWTWTVERAIKWAEICHKTLDDFA